MLPLPNVLRAGAMNRLGRMFLCHGLPADGTILTPHTKTASSSTNRLQASGYAALADQREEFFALLKLSEDRERFSVGCYRSGQLVEFRRTLNRHSSLDVRVRREFNDLFYGLIH